MLRTLSLHAIAVVLAGCGLPLGPEIPADTASIEPDLQAFDARGEPSPLDRLPRRPRLSLALASAPKTSGAASAGPWLLTGAADDALLDDLEKLPLTAAHLARSVAVQQRWDGQRIQLAPLAALDPGAVYTLAVPRRAAMTAFSAELHVDDSPQAGAALRGSFPAAGSAGVPVELAFALLTFDGEVRGVEAGIWLENSAGLAHPARVETSECASLDSAAISCVRIQPEEPLQPGSRYQLRSGRALQDLHGAAVDELHVGFGTELQRSAAGAADWQRSSCQLDQQALPIGCLLVGDLSLELSLFQNPALRVVARLAGRQLATLPSDSAAPLRFAGLDAGTHYALEVESIDGLLHRETLRWELQTAPTLPAIAISEVCADPVGAEPDQEYVELLNVGSDPVPFAGLCLSDSPHELGAPLPAAPTLGPSARALLVSDAYDPTDTRDHAPAAGSIIVRMGKSVTRGGLANAGEALFLRTCDGVRVSTSPAQPAPHEGECLVRMSGEGAPTAAAAQAWALSTCTPGQ